MSQWIGMPENTENYFGFVYIIKNNHPNSIKKYYIGCKQLLKKVKLKPLKGKKRKRITYKDNNVEEYWGSSTELLADIEKYGLESFTKEVVELCNSKFHMKYAELCWQLLAKAIFDEKSYNGIINVRLCPPKNFVDIERTVDKLRLDEI